MLFLPWLPSFLAQLAHTGTPWAGQQGLSSLPVALGAWDGGSGVQSWLFGLLLVVLAVVGAFAVPHAAPARRRGSSWPRACRGGAPSSWPASPRHPRRGRARQRGHRQRRRPAATRPWRCRPSSCWSRSGSARCPPRAPAASCCSSSSGSGSAAPSPGLAQPRSQAPAIAAGLRAAAPGDLVVFCPDQLGPSVSRVAPAGLQLVVYPDLAPAARVDWTDYAERNDSRLPDAVAADVLARSGGRAVWVVTGSGYRVPSDATCHAFVDDLAAFRGDPDARGGPLGELLRGRAPPGLLPGLLSGHSRGGRRARWLGCGRAGTRGVRRRRRGGRPWQIRSS